MNLAAGREPSLRAGARLVCLATSAMPLRSHLGIAGLLLGLVLFTGCAGTTGGKPVPVRSPAAKASRPADDYSTKAVEARTEAHARYAAGVLHDLNDEPDAAAQEFSRAALADLSNESLLLEASARLLRAKKYDRAIELLTKAAAQTDASGAVLAQLGLAYSVTAKKDLAITAYRKAIQKSPDTLAGYQYLAQLHLQNNEAAEGLKVLDDALKRPRADTGFLIELAETYTLFARAGNLAAVKPRVLEALKRAAAQNPTSPLQFQRLAESFNYLGEFDQAAEWYMKLAERFPHLPDVRNKLVEIFLRKQDRTNAVTQLRALLRETPTNPQANYLLGSLLFEERKMPEAIDYFRKTILLSPNFEPAYYDLAAAQINGDQPQAALESLREARRRFQQRFQGEFYSALAYTRMKDYTNALKSFTSAEIIAEASETNRLTPTFYFQLGSAHERNQHFADAEKYFRKSLALAPDFAEALNYLGYMWAERGENLNEARQMIEKAVKLEPKNGAFLDSLGWVLFQLDQPQEALKAILQALEYTEEPDPTLYDHLGDIYSKLKKTEQARDAWQKALRIEPNEKIEKKLANPPGGSGPR